MQFTDIKEILKLSKTHNIIPVYKEMLADLETPLSAYLKIDNKDRSFLLESIEGGEKTARYSFLGRDPFETFMYKDGRVTMTSRGKEKVIITKDPFLELERIFAKFNPAKVPGLPPFHGGAVGYIGYDVIKLYEKVPDRPKKDDLNWPDMYFMFTDILLIFDHVYHKIQVVCNVYIGEDDTKKDVIAKAEKACRVIDKIIADMKKPLKNLKFRKHKGPVKIKHHTSKKEYMANIKKAVDLLNDGEGIQVVLSQRFSMKFSGDPITLYRSLRTINPSPYMHFLRFGDVYIIGASPELMVSVHDGIAEVRPIAGTRPRGKTPEQDAALERELMSDAKERAEHVMLVDLGRNDIGRIASMGTVKVNDFMVVEKYSHVMHIVSNVTGTVKKGLSSFDVFKSTYPAGTVSGAPKVRAMQIIDEVENTKRGPYAGAVGVVGYSGDMETCISLRSIYYSKGTAYIQAGAGIVVDSKPEFEYTETLNKAAAVIKAVEKAAIAEEM
jgi:anthranilate synthase component 1